jgi:DNA-directed RNA polymerase subunit F
MRATARALAFALATAGVVCCFGCKRQLGEQADAGATQGALGREQSAQVLARVGDRSITLGDYVAALEHLDQFDRMRYQSPERRRELLGEMIDVMLLADEARDKGYDTDPVTQQEIREILRDALLKKAREGAPTPNEIAGDEVREYFAAHKVDFRDPERRRLSVIVLSNEAAANAVLDAAKKATPMQWGELVRARSIDPHAKANVPVDLAGDVGFVSPPGDTRGANLNVPEEVRAAAFDIAGVGDVLARVVKAGAKFYVVKLASRSDARDRTLQDSERAIRVKLAQEKMRAKEEVLLDELRRQYPVQIDEGALAQVKVAAPPLAGGAVDAGAH